VSGSHKLRCAVRCDARWVALRCEVSDSKRSTEVETRPKSLLSLITNFSTDTDRASNKAVCHLNTVLLLVYYMTKRTGVGDNKSLEVVGSKSSGDSDVYNVTSGQVGVANPLRASTQCVMFTTISRV